ncbi:MAG: ferrochelatase [Corynebacterium sp.]|nr:ferrochelatase [Corynebacterium sp.]
MTPTASGTASHPTSRDGLLLLSFGAPDTDADIVPFLENVTRGKPIPHDRLLEVAEHYRHLGGSSPLNEINRQIIANVQARLTARADEVGGALPVYFGNRNWHPYATEAADAMVADGIDRVFVFATSAWAGSSACRQYDEDIDQMRHHALSKNHDLTVIKLSQFYDLPGFIVPTVDAVTAAAAQFPAGSTPRLVFTGHSIPNAADENSGTPADGALYSRQVHEAARLVAERLGVRDYDVVWQSRSGNPHTPWLEPDVVDHARALAAAGVTDLLVCPIGFIADHTEVIWDLDTELKAATDELGMRMVRAATVGTTEPFANLVVDLLLAARDGRPLEHLSDTVPTYGCTINGAPCFPDCCQSVRPHHRSSSLPHH